MIPIPKVNDTSVGNKHWSYFVCPPNKDTWTKTGNDVIFLNRCTRNRLIRSRIPSGPVENRMFAKRFDII